MKLSAALLLILLPSLAAPLPLNVQEVHIRWARFRYNLNDRGESFIRAHLRLENGRKGSEAGLNPIRPQSYESRSDPQAYSDITAPNGTEQHGRLTRRLIRKLQEHVLDDPKRRAEFMIYWAQCMKAKSTPPMKYMRLLQKLEKQEWKHIVERNKNGGYDPTCQ